MTGTAIRFVVEGAEVAVDDAGDGETVMEVAKRHAIEGIDADCGGSMVCGTCHVYVLDGAMASLPPPSGMESEMLDYVPDPHPEARLSCQIRIADCRSGMRFAVPSSQR